MKNVLIACEESQTECIEFRKLGINAFSCDLQDCSGGHPEWHIKGDCWDYILDNSWDLIIAHPPCTYLAKSGLCHLYDQRQNKLDADRMLNVIKARDFFMAFCLYGMKGHRVAIENPVPHRFAMLPKQSQIIQPYAFGDIYSKQTCLWLFNVPPLMAKYGYTEKRKTPDSISYTSLSRDIKTRSKSFPGIAKAMAEQWSKIL